MTSATEVLRRMLDERGVEWHDTKIGKGFITVYEHDGITWIVTEHSSGRLSVKGCVKPTQGHYDGMTPEQAIAATLGPCNCTNDCTNSERTETCADGGTVSETYIRPAEEGSICPMPRASVIFEWQKLTFDEEDSARFAEIVKRHLHKLAGVEVDG